MTVNGYVEQLRLQTAENARFQQISGPNPIVAPGPPGSWDDGMTEMCDILKDNGKYYLYYHATGNGENYRIGVAVADNPLGPFVKYGDKPVLDLMSFGSCDDKYIACGSVIKEKENQYYMFYSLQQKNDELNFYIGLATAEHPLGPWKKYEHNPIMKNFGYVGGVTKKDGKYYMFNEYPIHLKVCDYGPICVATADRPEGPWTMCGDEPVLTVEDWGVWDDAGYSECNVKYDGGLFHMFYGGGKVNQVRLLTRESIGYAYSLDGKNFIKHPRNPVARREVMPYGAAMAEVCFLLEYPYVYLYHTLRYTEPWMTQEDEAKKFPELEHIGVQVLCLEDNFQLSYPVYELQEVAPRDIVQDLNKLPLQTSQADRIALTVRCRYADGAKKPLRIHLHSGYDEKHFDTEAIQSFDLAVRAGETVQQTFETNLCARFLKIFCENMDDTQAVQNVDVWITQMR